MIYNYNNGLSTGLLVNSRTKFFLFPMLFLYDLKSTIIYCGFKGILIPNSRKYISEKSAFASCNLYKYLHSFRRKARRQTSTTKFRIYSHRKYYPSDYFPFTEKVVTFAFVNSGITPHSACECREYLTKQKSRKQKENKLTEKNIIIIAFAIYSDKLLKFGDLK